MTAHAERESAHPHDRVDATRTNTIAARLLQTGWTRPQLNRAIYGPHAGGSWSLRTTVTRQIAERMSTLQDTPAPKPKLTLADQWTTPDWYPQAKCKGMDSNLFFPERGNPAYAAYDTCATCPVRSDCRQHALDTGEHNGIWGATSERERRRIRRQQRTTNKTT